MATGKTIPSGFCSDGLGEEEEELQSQEPINPEEAKAQLAATKPPSPKDKDPLEY